MPIAYKYKAAIETTAGKPVCRLRYRPITAETTAAEFLGIGRNNCGQTLEIATVDPVPEEVAVSPANYRVRVGERMYILSSVRKQVLTPVFTAAQRKTLSVLSLR